MPVFRRAGAGAHATLPRTSSKKKDFLAACTFTFVVLGKERNAAAAAD